MSSSISANECLNLPKFPPSCDTPDALAKSVLNWILDNIPYSNNGIYRPELAVKRGGGNCYAQALGGLALLDHWDVPSGIVLDGYHAHVVVLANSKVQFIDPYSGRQSGIRNPLQEGLTRDSANLGNLYSTNLPTALADGSFIHYYYQDNSVIDNIWHLQETTTLRGNTSLDITNNPHVIVDSALGQEMLPAIGDLLRYHSKTKDYDHIDYNMKYERLIDSVPDFIDPLTPSSYYTEF